MRPILHIPSPIQVVDDPFLHEHGVTLHVKREDKIHPLISGNKWRKLKYNLESISTGIITFGGAFSNHIHATAAAAQYYNLPAIAIIRGEYDADNPTLQACQNMGMQLRFVDRASYRLKQEAPSVQEIIGSYPDYELIPEGGSNDLAIKGVKEISDEIEEEYDYIAVSAGTGATAAGLILSMPSQQFLVFSSLKGSDLKKEFGLPDQNNYTIIDDAHLGGYGKTPLVLIDFINDFYDRTGIPLDPIYNGKLVKGLYEKIKEGDYQSKKILWIHTGGLQGIAGYNYLANKKNKPQINVKSTR